MICAIVCSCVSIPKETVILSETLGSDLNELQRTHVNFVELYFHKAKDQINSFVDDVYAPYVIHYVLESEFEGFKEGDTTLFTVLEIAARTEGKKEANDAINEMFDFQTAARDRIESKRDELLSPITHQQDEILSAINQSYENAKYANSTITGYLKSVRKVKETQQEALSMIGMTGVDSTLTNSLIKLSGKIDDAIKEGKKIDIQSDNALNQIESISNKIKGLIK